MLGESAAANASRTRPSSVSVRARLARSAGVGCSMTGFPDVCADTVRLPVHDASARCCESTERSKPRQRHRKPQRLSALITTAAYWAVQKYPLRALTLNLASVQRNETLRKPERPRLRLGVYPMLYCARISSLIVLKTLPREPSPSIWK